MGISWPRRSWLDHTSGSLPQGGISDDRQTVSRSHGGWSISRPEARRLRGPARRSRAGVARGGVPVAYEVARALGVPLDVFLVRKLGVPGHEELAMGAIASGGLVLLNEDMVQALGIGPSLINEVISTQRAELEGAIGNIAEIVRRPTCAARRSS